MKTRLTLCKCIMLAALAAAVVLLAGGCGGGLEEDPAKFVGTWTRQYPEDSLPSDPDTIVLRGDGSATRGGGLRPDEKKFTWLVHGGQLVLTPRGGTRKISFNFCFDGPDELTLIPLKGTSGTPASEISCLVYARTASR